MDEERSTVPFRRWRWLTVLTGGFLVLLGTAGLVGEAVQPGKSYFAETYGAWGVALNLAFEVLFVALGAYLVVRGVRGRHGSTPSPRAGLLGRVDQFSARMGERSRWNEYSPTKRRVAASLLTLEAAVVSGATAWLLSQAEDAEGPPWFIGGAMFIWMAAFVWGLTINPAKATRWGLLLGIPFILIVGVGGSLLWLAVKS
jgi:hypothetical protein